MTEDPAQQVEIHVAGNTALDLLVRDVPPEIGAAADGWRGGNAHFLDRPLEPVLGGQGGGTALVLGKLGRRVTLNTQIGTDAFGTILRSRLAEVNVDVVSPPSPSTAVNVILLDADGLRRSFYFRGERVDWLFSRGHESSKWFFAGGYGGIVPEDLKRLRACFRTFRGQGTEVAFDIGPWFAGQVSPDAMRALWQEVDCLIGTESELSVWASEARGRELVEQLLNRGPGRVVVKRGAEGAAFGGAEEAVDSVATEAVCGANTTGAGDTFNAALLHGLCANRDLSEAVPFAVDLATKVVKKGRGIQGVFED